MGVPRVYRKSPDVGINFSFFDIAAGTGFQTYFCGRVASGGLTEYKMSQNQFYSSKIITATSGAHVSMTLKNDVDFDVLMNTTRTVRGDAIINIPSGIQQGTTSEQVYLVNEVIVRKWDGTTETDLATASGSLMNVNARPAGKYRYFLDSFPISIPETTFQPGETLRVTVNQYEKSGGATPSYVMIGHSPFNIASGGTIFDEFVTFEGDREGTNIIETKTLSVQIPFKLDL